MGVRVLRGSSGWGALFSLPLAISLFLAVTGAFAQGTAVSGEQVRAIAEKLQCPVCQGTSVADSPSQVAQDMRGVIRAKLEAGEQEPAIVQYFVDRYGPAILREPPKTGFNSAVWWVPPLALAIGAGVVFLVVRTRKGHPVKAAPEQTPEEMEEYRKRLRDLEHEGS